MAHAGALAIAKAAGYASMHEPGTVDPEAVLSMLHQEIEEQSFRDIVAALQEDLTSSLSLLEIAEKRGLGKGITGFMYHTVPFVLLCWLRSPRLRR